MRRYSKQIQIEREEILKRFYGFSQGHAVYAIVHRNIHGKIPIYVGESKNPKKRFKQHLAVMFGGRKDKSKLADRLRMIRARAEIIEFQHLETVKNVAFALAREASWAQALTNCGFELSNTWPEHQSSATSIGYKRLMARMVASDLEKLATNLQLVCQPCNQLTYVSSLDLKDLSIYDFTLSHINQRIMCDKCSSPMNASIKRSNKLDKMLQIDRYNCNVESFKSAIGIV